MNVQILCFSARQSGNCADISQTIAAHHASDMMTIHHLEEMNISPCRGCNYECFRQERCPHSADDVHPLYETLSLADLVYFVLPNYCNAPPALYFAFNERSACFFGGREERLNTYLSVPKRFVVVSSHEAPLFRELLQQHTDKEPDLLFLSAKDYGQKSLEGRLMACEEARHNLRDWLNLS